MSFEIPHLTYSEIGQRARDFLAEHHPEQTIPVPIEKIIELKLRLNIYPFPRLYKDHGLNGYLTADRTTIMVDENQYDQWYEKCRFTLAHELAHYVLHEPFFNELKFEWVEEYLKWREFVSSEIVDWLEIQGNAFSGHILVPTHQLEDVCKSVVEEHRDTFNKMGSIPDDAWSYISNEVARYFEVNPQVVEIRITKEGIPGRIDLR